MEVETWNIGRKNRHHHHHHHHRREQGGGPWLLPALRRAQAGLARPAPDGPVIDEQCEQQFLLRSKTHAARIEATADGRTEGANRRDFFSLSFPGPACRAALAPLQAFRLRRHAATGVHGESKQSTLVLHLAADS